MNLPLVALVGVVAGALYWAYKKIREAPYQPGMVAQASQADNFDDAKLVMNQPSKETTIWKMPQGIDIFYLSPPKTSKSLPPVLGIHGGPAIAPNTTWKISQQVSNLYVYHGRGCGQSTRPLVQFPTKGMWPGIKILEEQLGIGMQVADMERIRRRLQVDQLDLVGHSFGGFLATLYAAEFPQHVRSLTLLVPAAVLKLPSKTGDLFSLVQDKIKEDGNPEELQEFQAFMKRYLDLGSLPRETDASLALRQVEFAKHYHRAVGTPLVQVSPEQVGGMACFAMFCSMGMEHDYSPALRERLASTTFPVSIVHGAQDLLPVATSRDYVNLFPSENVSLKIIEDGDHDLFDHTQVGDIVVDNIKRASSK